MNEKLKVFVCSEFPCLGYFLADSKDDVRNGLNCDICGECDGPDEIHLQKCPLCSGTAAEEDRNIVEMKLDMSDKDNPKVLGFSGSMREVHTLLTRVSRLPDPGEVIHEGPSA